MHESGLAASVLAALRTSPGPYRRVRVHVGDVHTSERELAERLRAHLDAADPPVPVDTLEVVLRDRQRLCSRCAAAWSSPAVDPPCPGCGGAPLPVPHDHRMVIELER